MRIDIPDYFLAARSGLAIKKVNRRSAEGSPEVHVALRRSLVVVRVKSLFARSEIACNL
jgi:hypothetical protein